jgi:hypothetical protein
MRCKAAGFSHEKFQRDIREMLLEESDLLLHCLFCERCGTHDEAERVLAIAGWDELSYLEVVAARELRREHP